MDSSKNPRVSIIILNWNGWEDTVECLESLYQITYKNYDLILVDNGSENNSVDRIKEYCKGKIKVKSRFFEYSDKNKPIKIKIIEYTRDEVENINEGEIEDFEDLPSNRKLIVIKNDKNYGFSMGNNIAIRYSIKSLNPDYILLLNNDTVVDPKFLNELVKVAECDAKIGFTGPKIYYYTNDNIINFAGGRISMWKGRTYHIGVNEIDTGQHDEIKEVDYVEGSCMLIRGEILNKIGLLDPDYFAYWEEIDFCVRGFKAGYKSVYVPTAVIWHKISGSYDDIFNSAKIYLMTRNRILFMKKNARWVYRITFIPFFAVDVASTIFIIFKIKKRNPHALINSLKAIIKGTVKGVMA